MKGCYCLFRSRCFLVLLFLLSWKHFVSLPWNKKVFVSCLSNHNWIHWIMTQCAVDTLLTTKTIHNWEQHAVVLYFRGELLQCLIWLTRHFLYLITLVEKDLQMKKTSIYLLCSLHQGANPIIKKNVEQAQCDIATLHFCEWKKWQTFKLSNVCNPSREQPWNSSKKNSTDCLVLKIQQKTSLFDIKKLSFWSKNAETFLENDLKSWFDPNRVMVARFKVGMSQASPNFYQFYEK